MLNTNEFKSGVVATILMGASVLFFCSFTALAQTATGGLRGVVTDPSGAALHGANVVARNPATGTEIRTTTNSEGIYSIPRILPGRYSVVVEAPGFKKTEFTDIEVSIGKDTVVDAKLEPGAISEVVNVAGGAEALVQEDTGEISTPFNERKGQEPPVNIPGQGTGRY